MDARTGCPDDYDELFRLYWPTACYIVRNSGIAPEDVQDVASEMLADFIDTNRLAFYDSRKAKFNTFFRNHFRIYVMAKRDKQMTRHRREPYRLEKVVASTEDGDLTWAETEFYAEDPLEAVETSVVVISAMLRSREILVQRSTDKRDYKRFCELVEPQLLLDGRIDRRSMRDALGVSASTLAAMWTEYRAVMGPLVQGCA